MWVCRSRLLYKVQMAQVDGPKCCRYGLGFMSRAQPWALPSWEGLVPLRDQQGHKPQQCGFLEEKIVVKGCSVSCKDLPVSSTAQKAISLVPLSLPCCCLHQLSVYEVLYIHSLYRHCGIYWSRHPLGFRGKNPDSAT